MLSPEQLSKLSEISNPLVRQRFSVFYQLPADLQKSMLAEETAGSIWNLIKEEYHLPETSISATARIIGLIFLGELPIQNFIGALQNGLKIDAQTAQMIAQDINQAIFQPVKESLMAVHGLKRDANQRTPKENLRFPTGQVSTNDTNTNANQNTANNNSNRIQQPPAIKQRYTPPQPQINAEATQRQREELLNKLKNQSQNYNPRVIQPTPPQNQTPPLLRPPQADYEGQAPARPATWQNIPKKNVVDLRNAKKKNGYNGFFSA